MTAKEEIISGIVKLSGMYSPYVVFFDWCKMSAIAIANSVKIEHDYIWDCREKDYIETCKKYNAKEQKIFADMFALLSVAFEEKIEDVLGDVFMKSGCGNKALGQFFTPYHIARLNAELGIDKDIPEKMILNEPSVGGGANVIAAADVLKSRGINYQNVIRVVAQDLDQLAIYMSYVQFSLLGIDAVVMQGDTLKAENYPEERIWRTPKNAGAIV